MVLVLRTTLLSSLEGHAAEGNQKGGCPSYQQAGSRTHSVKTEVTPLFQLLN